MLQIKIHLLLVLLYIICSVLITDPSHDLFYLLKGTKASVLFNLFGSNNGFRWVRVAETEDILGLKVSTNPLAMHPILETIG